ncbi:glucose/arabinose dehydrogenase [Nocardia sp. GAS34]|uniref:DUF4232 domain-containing protein n=1 Tax=unclassified Nocardia TaxID=2637762 RepID=UPI003D1C1B25
MASRATLFTFMAVAATAALAGCSSTTASGPATVAPSTSASPGTTTAAPASSASQSTDQSAPSQGSAATEMSPCADGQLVVSAQSMGAAMMHRGLQLSFTLAPGAAACTLSGYPGVDTGAGGPVVHAQRTIGNLGASVSQVVVVQSGHPARAVVEASAMGPNSTECTNYSTLLVTPPNVTQSQTVTFTLPGCELQVHPVTP